MARTKRERRRANEIKTKTIQRMQLQMTAPMDIGMEQHDASLGFGQEDIFDLTGAERGMSKRGGVNELTRDEEMPESESDEEESEEEDEEMLDSEEERERKVAGLEAELDGMYDVYQTKMRERNAKFKVKEQRKKSGQLEEWHGVTAQGNDDESDEEEGGYEKVQEAKERVGEDDSSSDDSDGDDSDAISLPIGQKRRKPELAAPPSKRAKLLTKLNEPISTTQASQAAQVWFSQGIFAGMDGMEDIEDEEQEEADEDISMAEEGDEEDAWQDEVCIYARISRRYLTYGHVGGC